MQSWPRKGAVVGEGGQRASRYHPPPQVFGILDLTSTAGSGGQRLTWLPHG